jgi:hypothetical protein
VLSLRESPAFSECLTQLSKAALHQLDVELAARAFRLLGDAGIVAALERLRYVEDRALLAGHVCLLRGDVARAQDLFLQSSNPLAALDMRCDLLHWDDALALAARLAPARVPAIAAKCAQQCELKGAPSGVLVWSFAEASCAVQATPSARCRCTRRVWRVPPARIRRRAAAAWRA